MRFARLACVALLLAACGNYADSRPPLTVAPQSVALPMGATQRFSASDAAAAWSVAEGPGGGSIDPDGTYRAPAQAGTYHVVATARGETARAAVEVGATPSVSVTVDPQAADLVFGATLQLRATVTGAPDRSVLWSVREGGDVDSTGLFRAPQTAGLYHVVASSRADPSRTAAAAISVSARSTITLSIDPPAAALQPGASLPFHAAVTGTSDTAVHWFVAEGAAGGSVDGAGLYSAPAAEGAFHLVAVSDADATRSASAAVQVSRALVVSISPPAATVSEGTSQLFTATASGSDPRVIWSIAEGDAGGSIDANGLYTAPRIAGTYHLVATSVADPSRSATAAIAVPAQTIAVSMAPASITVGRGAQTRFTVSITGTSETRAYWTADAGAIAQDGTYTAPQTEGTYQVTAHSLADPTKSASAAVTVVANGSVAVQIDPPKAAVHVGDGVQFRARVSGSADGQVSWSIAEGAAGGSIDAAGLYRSPTDHEGVYHVVAVAHADATKSGSAAVTVSWFDLIDQGGPVVPVTRTFALWWGDAAGWPTDARSTIETLLSGLNGSAYLAVADQYLRGARAATAFSRSLYDGSTPPTSGDPAAIGQRACAAMTAAGAAPQAGDFVAVYGSSSLDSPTYCAWHWYVNCGTATILIAWVPNPKDSGCVTASRGCNGASDVANSLATGTAHELMEAITDPYVGTWMDVNGQEIGDKCQGDLRCIALGGSTFQIQSEYANATHACAF